MFNIQYIFHSTDKNLKADSTVVLPIISKLEGIKVEQTESTINYENQLFNFEITDYVTSSAEAQPYVIFNMYCDSNFTPTVENQQKIDSMHRLGEVIVKFFYNSNDWKLRKTDDSPGKYYSSRAYGTIYDLENTLRKLLSLLLTNFIGFDWEDKENIVQSIRNKKRDRAEASGAITQNYLYNIDFFDLNHFFTEKYSQDIHGITLNNRIIKDKLHTDTVTIEDLEPYIKKSNWERFISDINDKSNKKLDENDFSKSMKEIREIRNKTAHNYNISFQEFKKLEKSAKQIITWADELINNHVFNAEITEDARTALQTIYTGKFNATEASKIEMNLIEFLKDNNFSVLDSYQTFTRNTNITKIGGIHTTPLDILAEKNDITIGIDIKMNLNPKKFQEFLNRLSNHSIMRDINIDKIFLVTLGKTSPTVSKSVYINDILVQVISYSDFVDKIEKLL